MLLVSLTPPSADAFCFEEAGTRYSVPPGLLWAIARVESGFDHQAYNRNGNGSYDVGVMQINSSWEKELGPDLWRRLQDDPCTNVQIGAWVLAGCLQRHGYTWEGVGCYNARSTDKRADYARRVIAIIEQMHRDAESRLPPAWSGTDKSDHPQPLLIKE
ncbi:MAG: lytic transglycosylase domain-containing protein, partial [Desulfuromonadales bacterium]|nr:lytic transglycosylase domain-containing protein [Desulfuromonadales bacterium]